MSLYKTGHRDFPSLEKYTSLIESQGLHSAEAAAYLARFPNDTSFVKQAEAIRNTFLFKDLSKDQNDAKE
jgi:hypothetical protein